jgi:hypothetical protein
MAMAYLHLILEQGRCVLDDNALVGDPVGVQHKQGSVHNNRKELVPAQLQEQGDLHLPHA